MADTKEQHSSRQKSPGYYPSRSRSSPSNLSIDSNIWLVGFTLAVVAILFSREIGDIIYANDENRLLRHHSAQRSPNISAWTVVPMENKGGGYGVVAVRDITPGELIMKENPLVRVKVRPMSVDHANQMILDVVQDLSGEDRNRFLSLSNAWENRTEGGILLNKYSGILQTNGMSSGQGYISIFPSISRLNHACVGAVNAVYSWRENEKYQVVHATKLIRAGEEIFVTYIDSKLSRQDRQSTLQQAYGFTCSCAVCSLDEEKSAQSDYRITRINSLKASLNAWSAGSMTGSEAINLIEDAIQTMRQEGMTYEFGQLYADASHVATAHSDFRNGRHYAKLALEHFTIELGPDSVQVAVAKKIIKNPTSSSVWATRPQELVRPIQD